MNNDKALIDKSFVTSYLTVNDRWCFSHGSGDASEDLGAGMLYYALAYALKAKTCVCLGSGGGFVPRLMRQAQRDLGLRPSLTFLVDGVGRVTDSDRAIWGKPDWIDDGSTFRTNYPDVTIVTKLTREAYAEYFVPNGIAIDFLHIDADHHYEGVREDFDLFSGLVSDEGVITLHDTRNFRLPCGVPRLVEELRADARYSVIDLAISFGTAIVKRNPVRPV